MRMMMQAEMDMDMSNDAIKDGSLPKMIEWILSELKPETSYFYANHGRRTMELVFDMKDPAQIPAIVEPFFLLLKAHVEFKPVMNLDDLRKGLESWQKKAPEMNNRVQASPH